MPRNRPASFFSRTVATLGLAVTGLLPACTASHRPSVKSEQATSNYEILVEEYEARLKALIEKENADELANRSDDAEGPGLPELISEFVPRFRSLAEAHPDEEDSGKAFAWIVLHAWKHEDVEPVLKPLIDHFADQPYMKDVCGSLSHQPNRSARDALRSIAERTQSPDVRFWARYCGARHDLMTVDWLAVLRDEPDPAKRDSLRASFRQDMGCRPDSIDAAQLQREAEDTLETVERSAGDFRYRDQRIADLARSALFERRDLAIGRTAPDIQGEDVDGLTFSLDQYRGRVIMLDFWGNW